MRVSAGLLIGASFALTAATITNAFLINKQFYPSIVYLTKSSASMAVVYIQGLIFVYLLFQLVRRIFFGELRASESEHLSERTWHAIMETCLAFTVFRDDFSPFFVMQFVLLLFIKSLHWLSDDRVDMMERSPIITLKFHMRMMSLIAVMGAIDSAMVSNAYFSTLIRGPGAQIVFGFEYAVLMTMVFHVTIKYVLHMHDLRSAVQWEGKTVYMLYTELLISGMRCLIYLLFVAVMLRVHTFPLFAVRPFYLALRDFKKALSDVLLSRRAINVMNNRFPVVTAEELARMDATCIICREEMTVDSSPKRLPCNHVFHANCLRSWFQRQQTCPTCRTDILSASSTRVAAAAGNGGAALPNNVGGDGVGGAALQMPPNIFPFMAHQFAFQPPRAPNAHPAAGNAGDTNQGQTEEQQGVGAGNSTTFVPPPFFMAPPPFPMPGMFPAPFSFPTRPTFSGLTDDELRQLEGESRAALEARVRVLSDINTLLDAAVLQMQQYVSAIGSTVPLVPQQPAPDGSPRPGGSSTANSSDSSSSSTPNINEAASDESASPNGGGDGTSQRSRGLFGTTKSTQAQTSTGADGSESTVQTGQEEREDSVREIATGNAANGGSTENGTLSEIRQRRLQRFGDSP